MTLRYKMPEANNAWTNNDLTNYYITLPVRMWKPDSGWSTICCLSTLTAQSGSATASSNRRVQTVKPEPAITETPQHLIRALAYKVHPYQWPTIGKISHIANATIGKELFFKYYTGQCHSGCNGTYCFEETVALAEKWFKPYPRRNTPLTASGTSANGGTPADGGAERAYRRALYGIPYL